MLGMVGPFGIGELLILLVFLGFGSLGVIFWIWMLIDCVAREPSEGNDKLIWVIIIVFTHLIGALLYFFVRRPKRIAETGR